MYFMQILHRLKWNWGHTEEQKFLCSCAIRAPEPLLGGNCLKNPDICL